MNKALVHHLGRSVSFGRLSMPAQLLWVMLLPTSDDQGRGSAEPDRIKWLVCPNVAIDMEAIPGLLEEMAGQRMIHLYQDEDGVPLYQVVRWWRYQQLQWARPSGYPAPAGWRDRIRYQAGDELVTLNWDQAGGFPDGQPAALASAPASSPGSPPAGDLPGDTASDLASDLPGALASHLRSPLPGYLPGPLASPLNQINSTKLKLNQGPAPIGAGRAPPAPDPDRPGSKARARAGPAVSAFRRAAHRYPPKAWYDEVDRAVGDDPADLAFWERVIKAWVGRGWNPGNVSGRLACFCRHELPGERPARAGPGRADEPAGFGAIRQALEEERVWPLPAMPWAEG